MFRCNDCNAEFEEPMVEYETHGFDIPPYEKFNVCPMCQSWDIVQSKEICASCGCDIYPTDEIVNLGDEVFCTECAEVSIL